MSLWSSLQVATVAATESEPQLAVTASASQVLLYETVTFSASGGTAPYTYRVSAGGGTITSTGVYTAGAVLGTNTITVTDSQGVTVASTVTVQGGQGDGTFAGSNDYSATSGPHDVRSGDFDNDGILDLVVGCQSGGGQHIRLFVGNGDGTFQAGTSNPAGFGVRTVTVADFNADGNLDVAGGTTSSNFVLFLGNADNTFMPRIDVANPGQPLGIDAGDVDGDGVPDIVSSAFTGDTMSFYKGNGDGSFLTAATFGSLNGTRRVVLGDLNNDGRLDAVAGNQSGAPSTSAGATVFLGNGDGTFQNGVEYSATINTRSLILGDFNGDSRPDIVTFGDANGADITIFLGNGDGSFQAGLATTLPSSGRPRGGAACDYNADGNMDLAVADQNNGTVVILFGDGAGGFAAGPSLSAPGQPHAVHCRDLTGDGKMDLAMVSFTVNQLRVFVGN